jgi:hypothetical protein
LEWLASGELAEEQRLLGEDHVRECPACRRELASWRALLALAAGPAAQAEAECQSIDWDAVTGKIVAKINRQTMSGRQQVKRHIHVFQPLAAAAALLMVIGLGIYFWTHVRTETFLLKPSDRLSASVAARLQSGLAREEVSTYLRQSQLMLTDLLKDCASEDVAPWEIRLYSRQAKALLMKKKYFQQYLSEVEWSKIRNVSERIDWLNYEILQLEDRQLCRQINRLQQIMESENLLLKIRLVEKEFARQTYREV